MTNRIGVRCLNAGTVSTYGTTRRFAIGNGCSTQREGANASEQNSIAASAKKKQIECTRMIREVSRLLA